MVGKEVLLTDKHKVTKADIDAWLFGSGTKLTEPQKALFYQISLAHNLNPAKREIYAIPYGSNFNVIVGYEVYLKRAERTGILEWWEAGVKKEGQEYIGFCTIKRKDRLKETTIEAWFNEYNQGNAMWKNKPRTMIRKVAIAQAFRMVFPDELGGLPYTADEMEVNGHVIDVQPQIEMTRVEKMIASLMEAGKLGNAERFLDKDSSLWTDADIDKIEKAKKRGKSSSESSVTHDLPQGNTNGQVDLAGTVTSDQIDVIEGICAGKDIPVVAARPDGVNGIIDLSFNQAEEVINQLKSL